MKSIDHPAQRVGVHLFRGKLNRAVEYLPSDDEIAERRAAKQGLTTPERAVLLAYSKMVLFDDLLASPLPDDPYVAMKRGELLSPSSTARLLTIMSQTSTGKNRLKGGLKPGWALSHKTGTGQILGATQAGYNDIGVLTAPDGSSYAVAVMIKKTSVPLPTRMTLMNNVVRAVITQHEMTHGAAATL